MKRCAQSQTGKSFDATLTCDGWPKHFWLAADGDIELCGRMGLRAWLWCYPYRRRSIGTLLVNASGFSSCGGGSGSIGTGIGIIQKLYWVCRWAATYIWHTVKREKVAQQIGLHALHEKFWPNDCCISQPHTTIRWYTYQKRDFRWRFWLMPNAWTANSFGNK